MRNIRCVFTTTRLVHTTSVSNETVRYYADVPTANFDIIHDYLKLFWACRDTIAYVDLKLYVDDRRVKNDGEFKLKGMIESTLNQCDGSSPLTQLQMALLLDKVKLIKETHRRMRPGAEDNS